jgi:2-keto-3-deoxy-L-fuconate dehydrogenase
MLKRKSGCIINVASIAGFQGNVNGPHYAGYAASKAGLMGLTRDLATSWGRDGIRVNAIAPGAIDTPLLRRSFARHADPDAMREVSRQRHAMKRFGAAEEVASAALYLASDESSFTTGVVLPVDGGWLAA